MVNILWFRYPNTTILEGEDLNKGLYIKNMKVTRIYLLYIWNHIKIFGIQVLFKIYDID